VPTGDEIEAVELPTPAEYKEVVATQGVRGHKNLSLSKFF